MTQREIKFRGYCIEGWVYGYFTSYDGRSYIKSIERGQRFGCGIEVIPDSVGQFTGLKDFNGVEVYEGDLIQSTFNTNLVHIVRWADEGAGFGADNPELMPYVGLSAGCSQEWITTCEKVVIGNSYENPELLNK